MKSSKNNPATQDKSSVKMQLALKFTNDHLNMAKTSTLYRVLFTLNYHYSQIVERTREELKSLIIKERNAILGNLSDGTLFGYSETHEIHNLQIAA